MDKYILYKEETALMIIDIQERLIPAMKYGQKVIENTKKLSSISKALNIPIIITEQYPRGLGNTVSEINQIVEGTAKYEKMKFSACTEEVNNVLSNHAKKKIIVTGMETHVCVYQTVRDLLSNGYEVFVVSDAVCSRSKENYKNGLSLMSEMGAIVTNTETVFFDLMKEAGTPLFKELSKLIK